MKISAFADNPFLARMAGAPVLGLGGIGTIEFGEPNRAVGQTLDGDVGDTFLRALQSALGDEQRGAEDFLPQVWHP